MLYKKFIICSNDIRMRNDRDILNKLSLNIAGFAKIIGMSRQAVHTGINKEKPYITSYHLFLVYRHFKKNNDPRVNETARILREDFNTQPESGYDIPANEIGNEKALEIFGSLLDGKNVSATEIGQALYVIGNGDKIFLLGIIEGYLSGHFKREYSKTIISLISGA